MEVRPIDANWLKNNLNKVFHRECDELYGMMQLLDEAPTLTPPNEWVSVEQLREMDGEPVWDENGKCYLVDTTYRFCSCSDIEIAIVDKNGDVKRYPQRRALYRRPPEGEANA